jgi:hypothetical protein
VTQSTGCSAHTYTRFAITFVCVLAAERKIVEKGDYPMLKNGSSHILSR